MFRTRLRIALFSMVLAIIALPALSQPVSLDGGKCFWAISVPDVEASVKWYQKVFGLQIIRQLTTPDGSVKLVVLDAPNLTVEIVQIAGAVSIKKYSPDLKSKAMEHGVFKVGLFVRDIRKARRNLEQQKASLVTEIVTEEESGLSTFSFLDNSGNTIQLFERSRR